MPAPFMSLPRTPSTLAGPLWAVTAGFLLLFTIGLHFYAPGTVSHGPGLLTDQGATGTLNLLKQILLTFGLSAGALVLIVALVYGLRPAAKTASPAASTAEFLYQAYQPRTAAPLRGYRPAEARPAASPWANASARLNKADPLRPQSTYQSHAQQARQPARPAPSLVPTPLALQAENLLRQAHTIPNFATTPLPGQRRVLVKLAENFVPAPQRGAALALAVFRLRQPVKAA